MCRSAPMACLFFTNSALLPASWRRPRIRSSMSPDVEYRPSLDRFRSRNRVGADLWPSLRHDVPAGSALYPVGCGDDGCSGALRLGHRAVGCETVGARAILRFDDGSTAEGDALIGADECQPVIRAELHGSDNAEFTGLVAWRGVIPMEDLPPRLVRFVSSNWVGPGRHVVQYPLRRGTLMNFVGVVEREDWRETLGRRRVRMRTCSPTRRVDV